ncbi:MAG: hypothetical protein WCP70_13560 [Methanothrix sp.]
MDTRTRKTQENDCLRQADLPPANPLIPAWLFLATGPTGLLHTNTIACPASQPALMTSQQARTARPTGYRHKHSREPGKAATVEGLPGAAAVSRRIAKMETAMSVLFWSFGL